MRFNYIDWQHWQPNMLATLLFVERDGKILLIHKKTGLGQGKINGPGGKIEAGETPVAAAIRECQEEVCITPKNPRARGIVRFQFLSDLRLCCHIFTSEDYDGTPAETAEADPFWVEKNNIPYHKMWEDDQYWLPAVLSGHNIMGYFLFDDDTMIDMLVRTERD